MSFFKKLFGFGRGSGASGSWEAPTGTAQASTEHEGYVITPTPVKEGGQFRLAGTITKEVNGEQKEHRLIRADLFPSIDDCTNFTVLKAKQVIKEQGERMFD